MNFLAHLYLAGNDKEVILGNFIADAVKGKAIDTYSPMVQEGIRMHREIDRYTDNHPVFKQSRDRLRPNYSLYSGVIVDIYYDHFLARYWNEYSSEDLRTFVADAYELLIRKFKLLPARSKYLLPFMISQNWLVGYSNFYSLQRVFRGMSRRARFESKMEFCHSCKPLQVR